MAEQSESQEEKGLVMSKKCELCKLYDEEDIKTTFYFKSSLVIVVDCLTCSQEQKKSVPMAVFYKHGVEPTEKEDKAIERECREYFGTIKNKEIASFRKKAKKIKKHAHWHIILKKGVKNVNQGD